MGQTPARRRRLASRRAGDPFWELVATARRLQAPGGCPWDRAQTVSSLLPCLLEETWEVFEAQRSRRYQELQEELGDVLYTVLFITLVAERHGWCDLRQLLTATRRKMLRRHPHVFGARRAANPAQAYERWHASKQQEGAKRHSPSRDFRKLLVACWDWLHAHPVAAERIARRLASARGRNQMIRHAVVSGWSPTPSARPRQSSSRSRAQT